MSTKKKLEKEILDLDQDIQAAHKKIDAIARQIRSQQNTSLEQSLIQSESYKNSATSSAVTLLEKTLKKAQEDILSPGVGGIEVASWKSKEWGNLVLPTKTAPPEFLRIGELILTGIAATLQPLPAILPITKHNHVFVFNPRKLSSPGIDLQCSILWRLLAFSSPQNYRVTFIDTLDRGRSFASFLNLPELVRGEKIYCQSREIEETLSKLLNEMEEIIQKRLRENYESIEDYNDKNPKTTIPYHFIIFSSFPDGFTEQALDHLVSIARSGPRAGFYIIGNIFTGENKFRDNYLENLADNACCISIESNTTARWDDPLFAQYPVQVDGIPSKDLSELISSLISDEILKISDAVDLMEFIPELKNWWAINSQKGLSAPLGLNEKGKVFNLDIGPQRDSFHALIGGRIHSGKTNFLHALILSLCTHYDPDEIELYLVDFKEGVEFQDYASFSLPHARAIVIEAEREFGLSVLEYLRDEMVRRSEKFKSSGVNDVNIETYRQSTGEKIPRILVIFDEFVRLFEEDDHISDKAYKIMLEIAQRSRAFGIHMILSSQRPTASFHNLNGVKSQINLRVAFKCNDTDDSILILGERNDKAAYLERLGVACITYDPNLPQTTDKVKVGYVSKEDRHLLLGELQNLSNLRTRSKKRLPTVFKKDEPVFWLNNPQVSEAINKSKHEKNDPLIWLGQPVRLAMDQVIKLSYRENDNLLCMGSDENLAFHCFFNSLLSLAISNDPNQSEFFWFQSSNQILNYDRYISAIRNLPHPIEVCNPSNEQDFFQEIIRRIEQRDNQGNKSIRIYCFFEGFHRIPLFRKQGSLGNISVIDNVGETLENLLRNGSLLGIHSLCWVDRYETLRNFRPPTSMDYLEFFRHRVAFHLDKDDANSFLGIPDPSKLGSSDKRVYYRDQEWPDRHADKIKPYELPDLSTLDDTIELIEKKWR